MIKTALQLSRLSERLQLQAIWKRISERPHEKQPCKQPSICISIKADRPTKSKRKKEPLYSDIQSRKVNQLISFLLALIAQFSLILTSPLSTFVFVMLITRCHLISRLNVVFFLIIIVKLPKFEKCSHSYAFYYCRKETTY